VNSAESVPVAENIAETIKTEAEPSDAVVRPHRVVDLINQGGDSGSSPCPRDTPEPVSGTPTKTNNDSELDSSNDHPNKKYNNTSLPAKKRKLFDQSDSSMPHSPLSISPTNMKNKPDKQSVLDAIVKTSGSEQSPTKKTSCIQENGETDARAGPEAEEKKMSHRVTVPNENKNELQSKEVSSSNIPVTAPTRSIPSKSPSPKPTPNPASPPPQQSVSISKATPNQRTISEEDMKPLKKRRLKAVIADALNQNLDESFSSNYSSRNISPINNITSDSDTLPLAIIRDRLSNDTKRHISPIKIRAEDHITDIESSLATFQSHVSTPSSLSAASSPDRNSVEPLNQSQNNNDVQSRTSKRRSTSGSTQFTNKELGQLSQFMGLSGSESDGEQRSESESDDDYRSRARVSKPALGQRRKTRSPSTSFSSPPPSSTPKPNSKKKKGEKQKETEQPENNDFIPDIEKDVILAKFFAAENAAFGMSDNERPQKGKPAGKAKKKIGKVGKKESSTQGKTKTERERNGREKCNFKKKKIRNATQTRSD
jgi:hypothetical protein